MSVAISLEPWRLSLTVLFDLKITTSLFLILELSSHDTRKIIRPTIPGEFAEQFPLRKKTNHKNNNFK